MKNKDLKYLEKNQKYLYYCRIVANILSIVFVILFMLFLIKWWAL